jgi:hypothetical protein
MSPAKYKYRYFHNGEWLLGNSIDKIAQTISESDGISFTKAVAKVSGSLVPVSTAVVEQKFAKEEKVQKTMQLQQVTAGATSAMKQISGFSEEQSVINRRAIVCSACPNKDKVSGCMSCGFASKITKWANSVKKMFGGGHVIPNNLDKEFCKSCNCSLAMMLPANLSDFTEQTVNDPTRPDTCWIKTESAKQ